MFMDDEQAPQPQLPWSDLTPQSRAARATYLLMLHREMHTAALVEALGYEDRHGVFHLMNNLSLGGVPVYQPQVGYWAILPTEG